MQIKVTHYFHTTRAAIRPHRDGKGYYITWAQRERLARKLCGMEDCCCTLFRFEETGPAVEALQEALDLLCPGPGGKEYLNTDTAAG